MKNIISILLLTLLPSQLWATPYATDLYSSINQRLGHMRQVALYKAQRQLPIENAEREATVIDKALASARRQGLDPASVEDFFRAQISVAKAVQYRHRADWLSQPTSEPAKDLQKQIRPALIRLSNKIIQQLADYCNHHGEFDSLKPTAFETAINTQHVNEADRQLLFNSLKQIKCLKTESVDHSNNH